jgi:hypothetical protein
MLNLLDPQLDRWRTWATLLRDLGEPSGDAARLCRLLDFFEEQKRRKPAAADVADLVQWTQPPVETLVRRLLDAGARPPMLDDAPAAAPAAVSWQDGKAPPVRRAVVPPPEGKALLKELGLPQPEQGKSPPAAEGAQARRVARRMLGLLVVVIAGSAGLTWLALNKLNSLRSSPPNQVAAQTPSATPGAQRQEDEEEPRAQVATQGTTRQEDEEESPPKSPAPTARPRTPPPVFPADRAAELARRLRELRGQRVAVTGVVCWLERTKLHQKLTWGVEEGLDFVGLARTGKDSVRAVCVFRGKRPSGLAHGTACRIEGTLSGKHDFSPNVPLLTDCDWIRDP